MAHMFMILSLAMGVGRSCAVALAVPSAAVLQPQQQQQPDSVCCNSFIEAAGKKKVYILTWTKTAAKTPECKQVDKDKKQCNLGFVVKGFREAFQKQYKRAEVDPRVLDALAKDAAQAFLSQQNKDPNPYREADQKMKAVNYAGSKAGCCNFRDPPVAPEATWNPMSWLPSYTYALGWTISCADAPEKGTKPAKGASSPEQCSNQALALLISKKVETKYGPNWQGFSDYNRDKRRLEYVWDESDKAVQTVLSEQYANPDSFLDSLDRVAGKIKSASFSVKARSKGKGGARPVRRLVKWALGKLMATPRV